MWLEPQQLNWRIINDDVMGGRSLSEFVSNDECLCFRGELSTENRGGFVSLLGRLDQPLTSIAGFKLVVSGDGRCYQFRLRESDSTRDVAWRSFFSAGDERLTASLNIGDFQPVMRGQPAIGAKPLELTPIHYLGFMLTSRRPGPFELRVHAIEVLPAAKQG